MKSLIKIALVAFASAALAQPYPSKPIHLVVAFPPGGPVDIVARLITPKLSETLGESIVVENRAGAGGNLPTSQVAKAAPDGYTLLAHSASYAINPSLWSNPGYDPQGSGAGGRRGGRWPAADRLARGCRTDLADQGRQAARARRVG